jgi:hypothetical protein
MKKEFNAIAVAYLVGLCSFIVQWYSDQSDPLKGFQVLSVFLCNTFSVYAFRVAINKKAAMLAIPSIILAGWGGFKFIFFVITMTIPVLIGGHTP